MPTSVTTLSGKGEDYGQLCWSTCALSESGISNTFPSKCRWLEQVGFDVWQLKAGESITLPSDERERCLVLVAGLASVKAADSFSIDWSAHESV